MRTLLLAALLPASVAVAQSPVAIELEPYATGLGDVVDIANAGDDRLFAVIRQGTIRLIDASGTVQPTPFLTIDSVDHEASEQGFLGLAFDPNYAENGFFYVNYIHGTGDGDTRISRFSVMQGDPDHADPTSEQVLYTFPQPAWNHNGGDLDFGPDGYLYFPLGDGGGGGSNNAQDLSDPLGDVIRIDVSDPDTTYTIPPSNPWVGAGPDTLPEIWASGLRNPFRFGFDAFTGDLWIGDVGAGTYEEVDFWPAGDNSGPNFGWPCYEGNTAYSSSGCQPQSAYEFPLSVHTHTGQSWCSVIGGRVYRGDLYPRLYGRYFYTDHCGGQFYSLHPDGVGGWVREQVNATATYGYTCIVENNALELFVGNRSTGIIYRMADTCPMPLPVVTEEGSMLVSTEASGYQWYLDGEPIDGATEQDYVIATSGVYHVVADLGEGCELASAPIGVLWTGIATQAMPGLEVYPVPASDRLIVEGLSTEVTAIALVDMAGRAVMTVPVANTARAVLTTTGVATGRYTLALYGADGLTLGQRPVSVLR